MAVSKGLRRMQAASGRVRGSTAVFLLLSTMTWISSFLGWSAPQLSKAWTAGTKRCASACDVATRTAAAVSFPVNRNCWPKDPHVMTAVPHGGAVRIREGGRPRSRTNAHPTSWVPVLSSLIAMALVQAFALLAHQDALVDETFDRRQSTPGQKPHVQSPGPTVDLHTGL